MKPYLVTMKADLKILAEEIRKLKSLRKVNSNGYVPKLLNTQESFRSKHIAYCMLRGRILEQIEPKLRYPNSITHTHVRKEATRLVAEALNSKPMEASNGKEDIRPSGQASVEIPADRSIWTRVTEFFL